jgi:hypothetical protein
VILTFWTVPTISYGRYVSENYRFYQSKMAQVRASRAINRPLLNQLRELYMVVAQCEARWESF